MAPRGGKDGQRPVRIRLPANTAPLHDAGRSSPAATPPTSLARNPQIRVPLLPGSCLPPSNMPNQPPAAIKIRRESEIGHQSAKRPAPGQPLGDASRLTQKPRRAQAEGDSVDNEMQGDQLDVEEWGIAGEYNERGETQIAHTREILAFEPLSEHQYPPAILLAETTLRERYIFSIAASTQLGSTGGKRTLVYLLLDGTLRCLSCATRSACIHKQRAAENALAAGIMDAEGFITLDASESSAQEDILDDEPAAAKQAVSFQPIPVPRWCQLPQDALQYVVRPPEIPPDLIPLANHSRCCCGEQLHQTDGLIISIRPFTVFGLRRAYGTSIEVADCTSCCHRLRQYGPDCGLFGIFNWNNIFGFTHELLNQYTNVFTTAAIPFSSFLTSTHRLYEEAESPIPLCGIKSFIRAWFAFTELQPLDSGMECIDCGKYPEIIIGDGVSIGYSTAKFARGLAPPTLVTSQSPVNTTVNLGRRSLRAAISAKEHRKTIQDIAAPKLPQVELILPSGLCDSLPDLADFSKLYLSSKPGVLQQHMRELLKQNLLQEMEAYLATSNFGFPPSEMF
ncbi:hypothetical protein HWV62_14356 [Athelia sp. TMB]|nr:hypothetical protein HWV62_14356 [Athelia sp. TMB]